MNYPYIDYASLYGVKPGEKDFSGAIKRALNENDKVKHIGNNFINAYKCLCQQRHQRHHIKYH